ncbi:histidine kinase [Mucilaginibacter terrenus]|uniref:histidine kinase n=1 Tax=Mucilaginibacter terrenus TaxID=2482727 RepID=A0A3E2NUX0_9SPHI|nr:sensor histidine kinase [Mucilaginibacter terrenus]RFZ84826.1 histidine kinase [Mucilaginibacter terrenus]
MHLYSRRSLKKLTYCLLIICASTTTLLGQSYSFVHYQVENGLSNNAVLSSLQDNKGFMWFGTKDGLNRFDGYTFKVFRNDADKKGSLGNNIIYCLYQDKDGRLWVGTDRGIYLYNELTERFALFNLGTDDEIRDIKADRSGNIWFIAGITLHKYNLANHKLTVYNKQGINAVSMAFVNGDLWVSTTARLVTKYDANTDHFTSVDVFSHSKPCTAYWIQKLADAGNGNLLVGTSNQGIKLLNTTAGTYRDVITNNEDKTEVFVRDFIKKSGNEYWAATESGIYNFNLNTGKAALLHKQYNDPYSLTDNAVYTFCKDREGGIWAGTYFGGLNYYAKQYSYFEKYFPKVGENSLAGNAVREIAADKKSLWIGTEDGGLSQYDINKGLFKNFKPLGKATDISTSNIHGLLNTDKELLIGTFEHGLDILNKASGKVIGHYTVFSDTTLKSNFFYTLYQTRSGAILAGTTRGLYQYYPATHKFRVITNIPTTAFYTSIMEDSAGNIWVGSYREGLFYYNSKIRKSQHYIYNVNDSHSISSNKVNRIFEDSSGEIWVATENGLCKYDKTRKNFLSISIQNGLPSNVIYTMLEDDERNLWISTSKGLVKRDSHTGNLKTYTKADGLLSDQFNYNSGYKDSIGNLYFGCVKGMIKFNPANFVTNTYKPPVYITGFQVNNQEIEIKKGSPLSRSVSFTDTVELQYNQSSFSIDFAALSYTSPQTAGYAYKMAGLDKDWVYLSTNRKVYFTRLSTGTYHFKVKATNSSGLWSQYNASLTIIIDPPYWASIYAWLIYGVLIASGIYILVRNYHRAVNEKNRRKIDLLENEKEKELYHAKITFFTHIAHEIRTPLTLIKGPMEKVMHKVALFPDVKKNLTIMERNIDRLLTLTNQLLDFRKTETHGFSLNFVKTDITEFIKDVLLRFRPTIEHKKLQVKNTLPHHSFYAYVDTEALNKILSNLVDNSLKYAVSKVSISLTPSEDDNTFTILVKNDGPLVPFEMKDKIFETFYRMKEAEKQSGTGIGLPLSRYLAELHKGSLNLMLSEDNMNTVALVLPIHQDIEFNL